MDKFNQHTYCSKNQFLIVERYFMGDRRIGEIVKQYMTERLNHMAELDDSSEIHYNDPCDKAVVTSAKEGSK